MSIPLWLDKLCAVARRDWLIATRYPAGWLMAAAGVAVELAGFFLLARAIGGVFRPEGLDFFPYLLVGTAFYGFVIAGINGFVSTLREAQVAGTLETLLGTATPPRAALVLNAASTFGTRLLYAAVYLGAGLLIFPVHLPQSNFVGVVLVLLLSVLIVLALGLMAAAMQVSLQRSGAVLWLFGSLSWLMTGTLFPVSALPQPLVKVAELIPMTQSITGLRLALLKGAGFGELALPLTILAVYALLLLPAGVMLLELSLRRARRNGTLGFY